MIFSRYILPSVNILMVDFHRESIWSTRLITTSNRLFGTVIKNNIQFDNMTTVAKELTTHPIIIFLNGYGVISKNIKEHTNIIAKVMADTETFLWTMKDTENICFIRRSQCKKLIDELQHISATVADIRCGTLTRNGGEIDNIEIDELIKSEALIKDIFKPTVKGSMLLTMVCKKFQLVLLFIVLIVVLINFIVGQSLKERYETQQSHLETMQKRISRQGDMSKELEELITQYNRRIPYRVAWICDRIGATLPNSITLLRFAVQPLRKPIENNESPVVDELQSTIEGWSPEVESVSQYITRLQNEKFIHVLKLKSIEQSDDTRLFRFVINVEL